MSNDKNQQTNDLIAKAISWRESQQVAIATVISTWGSAPRPTGSMMVINDTGLFEGSVSGGCVEGEVIHAGLQAIKSGQNKLLEFGVTNDDAINVGLACGGTIRILVEKLDDEKLAQLKKINIAETALWVKPLAGNKTSQLLTSDDATTPNQQQAITSDKSQLVEVDGVETFYHVFNPPLKMVIIGAVHIAQALAPMAMASGFDVTIIDPRGAFAQAERMHGLKVVENWPDEQLNTNSPDQRTAIVTLTHDAKLDDAALKIALRSKAFYVGCLGSKKTHAKRVSRLAEMGFSQDEISKIQAPIGLDIGAKSPSEIAVSILAQIIATVRGVG